MNMENTRAGTDDWISVCAARKKTQVASIPPEWIIQMPPESRTNVIDVPSGCGLLNIRELAITETTDIALILENLRTSKWSSVEVTTAFYKRAIIAHQLTNCLTEIFIDSALERAKKMDDYLAKHGTVVGPLHGLPISLKDQFTMKGLETIMGYAGWIGQYAKSDCVLVEILYECGAVPFVRTNVPQTLMWGETFNHVFGRTTNPYNRRLTPGGSSGGEGALLAMKGSPLGVGTDIGGSLRIPSAFCGLYTLRPSYERLPYSGAANALQGQESISSVLGPMANDISALKIFTKAILDTKPWRKDPAVVRKAWSEEEYQLVEHGGGEKLCFAIMWDNEVVRPHPPLRRAMRMVKEALERAGHIVIDWEPHRHLEIYKNAETIFVADGGYDYRSECAKSGEPLIETMIPPGTIDISPPVKEPLIKTLIGEPYNRTAWELWQLHKEKRDLRKSHLDHWQRTIDRTGTGRPVDAIISPAVAYTAVPHGMNIDSFYTTLCNALDYTCTVFPVTSVDPSVDVPDDDVGERVFYNMDDEAIHRLYTTHDTDFPGLPVALQLIGGTQEEEAIIAMTEIVDRALKDFKVQAK